MGVGSQSLAARMSAVHSLRRVFVGLVRQGRFRPLHGLDRAGLGAKGVDSGTKPASAEPATVKVARWLRTQLRAFLRATVCLVAADDIKVQVPALRTAMHFVRLYTFTEGGADPEPVDAEGKVDAVHCSFGFEPFCDLVRAMVRRLLSPSDLFCASSHPLPALLLLQSARSWPCVPGTSASPPASATSTPPPSPTSASTWCDCARWPRQGCPAPHSPALQLRAIEATAMERRRSDAAAPGGDSDSGEEGEAAAASPAALLRAARDDTVSRNGFQLLSSVRVLPTRHAALPSAHRSHTPCPLVSR